jgi:4-hydroxy-tetrahydrodipicolinate reductase
MTGTVPLALFGVTGRMGQCIVRALQEDGRFRLSGAGASAGSQQLGRDAMAGGATPGNDAVRISADPDEVLRGAAVAVDFSSGAAVSGHAGACARAAVPLLVGATALDEAALQSLRLAAQQVAIVVAPNTSVGMNVLIGLAARAAASLGSDYDVEVFEAHHRLKRDAPSGTALALGEAVAAARGHTLQEVAVYDRHGTNAVRAPGSIGFGVLRAGDIVGEHTLTFAAAGERIELTHRATDRMTFARGALRAAEWLIGRAPRLYGMLDVLGMDSGGRHR